jgi:hypothetical protein
MRCTPGHDRSQASAHSALGSTATKKARSGCKPVMRESMQATQVSTSATREL